MPRPEDFDVQELIDYLQGTCNTLQEGCDLHGMDEMDLTSEDHDAIDNQIFLCDTCGWWCESCQQASEDGAGNCEDCWESTQEDEE